MQMERIDPEEQVEQDGRGNRMNRSNTLVIRLKN
jgi:hypothetical protein